MTKADLLKKIGTILDDLAGCGKIDGHGVVLDVFHP